MMGLYLSHLGGNEPPYHRYETSKRNDYDRRVGQQQDAYLHTDDGEYKEQHNDEQCDIRKRLRTEHITHCNNNYSSTSSYRLTKPIVQDTSPVLSDLHSNTNKY